MKNILNKLIYRFLEIKQFLLVDLRYTYVHVSYDGTKDGFGFGLGLSDEWLRIMNSTHRLDWIFCIDDKIEENDTYYYVYDGRVLRNPFADSYSVILKRISSEAAYKKLREIDSVKINLY